MRSWLAATRKTAWSKPNISISAIRRPIGTSRPILFPNRLNVDPLLTKGGFHASVFFMPTSSLANRPGPAGDLHRLAHLRGGGRPVAGLALRQGVSHSHRIHQPGERLFLH